MNVRKQVRLVQAACQMVRCIRGWFDGTVTPAGIPGKGEIVECDVCVRTAIIDVETAGIDFHRGHPGGEQVHRVAYTPPCQHVTEDGLVHIAHDEDLPERPASGLLRFHQATDNLHVFFAKVLSLQGKGGGREDRRVGDKAIHRAKSYCLTHKLEERSFSQLQD